MNLGYACVALVGLAGFLGVSRADYAQAQQEPPQQPVSRAGLSLEEEGATYEIALARINSTSKPCVRATAWRKTRFSDDTQYHGVRLDFGYRIHPNAFEDSWDGTPLLVQPAGEFHGHKSITLTPRDFERLASLLQIIKHADFGTPADSISSRVLEGQVQEVRIERRANGWSVFAGDSGFSEIDPQFLENLLSQASRDLEALRAASVSVDVK